MYKLTIHVRSAKYKVYSDLQVNIAVGIVTDDMMAQLQKRVQATHDSINDNDWYKDGRQVMITSTHEIKDEFNIEQLSHLPGDIIELAAKDIRSKFCPIYLM